MKALTLREPWGSLIVLGKKTIETRVWSTAYRGPLILTASATPKGLLSGHAFAIITLVDCRPMTAADEAAACCPCYPGAYAWLFTDLRVLLPVYPIKGRLRLFEIALPKRVLQVAE